jgi:hypothetical protein
MFESLSSEKRQFVLEAFHVLLSHHYSRPIAVWIYSNWDLIEKQTLILIRHLLKFDKEYEQIGGVLTIGKTVDITGSIDNFIAVTKWFLGHPKSTFVLEYVTTHKVYASLGKKLNYKDYSTIVSFLMTDTNKHMLEEHKESLLELDFAEWINYLIKL